MMVLLIILLAMVALALPWIEMSKDRRVRRRTAAIYGRLLTHQVTYIGCTSTSGPCGAIENADHPAPLFCPHHGIKTEAK